MSNPALEPLTTGPTLADQAYRVLREEIISGKLEPGERITERDLAARLSVSPTPIREALSRLEHEHLIERTETRRLIVAEPSIRRLYELTLMEAALRGVGARLAAENASDRELADIKAAHARFTELISPPEMLAAARDLHRLIDEASHNDVLIKMIATATAFDLKFRVETIPDIYAGNRKAVIARHREHGRIVAAIVRRDGEAAEELMRSHILGATAAFIKTHAARERK